MRRRILCYGDSNTWGYDPRGGRYDESVRWPMAMASLLGTGYTVIEEGLNGRTFCFDDPVEGGYKNGETYLPPCLMTANPVDAVLVMLGTNDTKERFNMNGAAIAYNLIEMARLIRAYGVNGQGESPRILFMAPAPIGEHILSTHHGVYFGAQAPEKSRQLVGETRRMSRLMRCEFLNAGDYCAPSALDAVHLTAEGHRSLGRAAAEKVRTMFEDNGGRI